MANDIKLIERQVPGLPGTSLAAATEAGRAAGEAAGQAAGAASGAAAGTTAGAAAGQAAGAAAGTTAGAAAGTTAGTTAGAIAGEAAGRISGAEAGVQAAQDAINPIRDQVVLAAAQVAADRDEVEADRAEVEQNTQLVSDWADIVSDKAAQVADDRLQVGAWRDETEDLYEQTVLAAQAVGLGSLPFFETEAEGVAGVADGETFTNIAADQTIKSLQIQRRSGSTAVELAAFPSFLALLLEIQKRISIIDDSDPLVALSLADAAGEVAFEVTLQGLTRLAAMQIVGAGSFDRDFSLGSLSVSDVAGWGVFEITQAGVTKLSEMEIANAGRFNRDPADSAPALAVSDKAGWTSVSVSRQGVLEFLRALIPGSAFIGQSNESGVVMSWEDLAGFVLADLTDRGFFRGAGLSVRGSEIGVDTEYALSLSDKAGWMVAAIGFDGTPFGAWIGGGGGAASTAEEPTSIGSLETRAVEADRVSGREVNQVYLRQDQNVHRAITGGPYSTRLVRLESIDGNIAEASVYRQGAESRVRYRVTPIGTTPPGAPRRFYLVIGYGQSLEVALIETPDQPDPPWTGVIPGNAYMYDSSAFDGLLRGPRPFQRSPQGANQNLAHDPVQFSRLTRHFGSLHAFNGINGQTNAETMALALCGQHLQPSDHVLSCIIGTGSTEIAKFLPGTAHNDAIMLSIDRAAAEVTARNAAMAAGATPDRWELHVISKSQIGEQDIQIGTSAATFIARIEAVNASIAARVALHGGTYYKHIIQQTMYSMGGTNRMAAIAQGEMGKAGTAVVVPTYHLLPGGHSAHLYPLTYLPQGSAQAFAISELLLDPDFNFPHVKDGDALLTSPTTSVCSVSSLKESLVFDVQTIPNRPDGRFGVTMSDNNGPIAVSAVNITGADELTITHAPADLGLAPIVKFGLDGGAAQYPDPNGPRINFRDSFRWYCAATGQIVSSFPFAHQTALVAA